MKLKSISCCVEPVKSKFPINIESSGLSIQFEMDPLSSCIPISSADDVGRSTGVGGVRSPVLAAAVTDAVGSGAHWIVVIVEFESLR